MNWHIQINRSNFSSFKASTMENMRYTKVQCKFMSCVWPIVCTCWVRQCVTAFLDGLLDFLNVLFDRLENIVRRNTNHSSPAKQSTKPAFSFPIHFEFVLLCVDNEIKAFGMKQLQTKFHICLQTATKTNACNIKLRKYEHTYSNQRILYDRKAREQFGGSYSMVAIC